MPTLIRLTCGFFFFLSFSPRLIFPLFSKQPHITLYTLTPSSCMSTLQSSSCCLYNFIHSILTFSKNPFFSCKVITLTLRDCVCVPNKIRRTESMKEKPPAGICIVLDSDKNHALFSRRSLWWNIIERRFCAGVFLSSCTFASKVPRKRAAVLQEPGCSACICESEWCGSGSRPVQM